MKPTYSAAPPVHYLWRDNLPPTAHIYAGVWVSYAYERGDNKLNTHRTATADEVEFKETFDKFGKLLDMAAIY